MANAKTILMNWVLPMLAAITIPAIPIMLFLFITMKGAPPMLSSEMIYGIYNGMLGAAMFMIPFFLPVAIWLSRRGTMGYLAHAVAGFLSVFIPTFAWTVGTFAIGPGGSSDFAVMLYASSLFALCGFVSASTFWLTRKWLMPKPFAYTTQNPEVADGD